MQLELVMTGIDTVKSRVGSPYGHNMTLIGGTHFCLMGAWSGTCNSMTLHCTFMSPMNTLKNSPPNSG